MTARPLESCALAIITAALVLAGLAGVSWHAGRRYERERAVPCVVAPADDCPGRLAECWEANTSAVRAVNELAHQQDGCRAFTRLGVGPEVRR